MGTGTGGAQASGGSTGSGGSGPGTGGAASVPGAPSAGPADKERAAPAGGRDRQRRNLDGDGRHLGQWRRRQRRQWHRERRRGGGSAGCILCDDFESSASALDAAKWAIDASGGAAVGKAEVVTSGAHGSAKAVKVSGGYIKVDAKAGLLASVGSTCTCG